MIIYLQDVECFKLEFYIIYMYFKALNYHNNISRVILV
jgi:hypothetical protein